VQSASPQGIDPVKTQLSLDDTLRMIKTCTLILGLLFSAASSPAANVVLVAGGGSLDQGKATEVRLGAPFGAAFDEHGNMFLVEMTGQQVRKVDPQGILTTVAGLGSKGDTGDGGPATKAQFNGMHSLAVLPIGDVLVADTWNNRVRKIDAKSGSIANLAGVGTKGFSGDGGPASKAEFGGIYCVALNPKGDRLYLADLDNRRVRMVDLKSGRVKTIAGNGQAGVPHDGAEAVKAPLMDPRAVCADDSGNVYILERNGNALRVVNAKGKIRTVVGTGIKGLSGDGGDALKATLNGPKHLCVDREGNVIIADTENHVVRKYLPRDGKIVRVAGSGRKGKAGLDGSPERLEMNQPHGVYVHPSGTLYICDSGNNRVLKIVE
jgi:sugar lactone lactonase YvrE